jgi:transcriptional regulator GlxA family with amidase domain
MAGTRERMERMRQTGKTPAKRARTVAIRPELTGSALVDRLDAAPRRGASRPARERGSELDIGIVLWPGFPLLSLAGLCDALRHAADVGDQSRKVRCSWSVIGLGEQPATSSCGVRVPADVPMGRADVDYDYVAVIGGLLPRLAEADPRLAAYVRRAAAAGVPLIGICTGSFVLARLGLLGTHEPCIHRFHVEDWTAMFPDRPFRTDCHYHLERERITCAGGVSIIELAAELVRQHSGADRAAKVIHQMTVKEGSQPSQVARRHALGYDSSDHEKMRQAVVLMEKNIATPLEIGVIARLVGTSSRQLERVFLAETGLAPSDYYRQTRLKYGRWLLTSTDLPVVAVAVECGFADASHFIRHFQRTYGMPPGRLRKALAEAGT